MLVRGLRNLLYLMRMSLILRQSFLSLKIVILSDSILRLSINALKFINPQYNGRTKATRMESLAFRVLK